MYDFHIHTHHSFDADFSPAEMQRAAGAAGMQEICFTDHIDFDGSGGTPPDMARLCGEVRALPAGDGYPKVRLGVEVSMLDAACAQAARRHIAGWPLDFIIGSVHLLYDADPYEKREIFTEHRKEDCYREYLERICRGIRAFPELSALGHYDYAAKFATYEERSFPLSIAPELFDDIFTELIQNGKCIEINTASWREDPAWGLDVLKRYRALGGEFITVGSDAHVPERVGHRIGEALALARAAEIPYIATFAERKPVLHRL